MEHKLATSVPSCAAETGPRKVLSYKIPLHCDKILQYTRTTRLAQMIQPTRVLQLAKEKSQKLFSLESERFHCRLEKLRTVKHRGYSELKPKIFPKKMGTMFLSTVVVASEEQHQHRNFNAGFGSTASLKRHRMDWMEKYQRNKPGYTAEESIGADSGIDRSPRIRVIGDVGATTKSHKDTLKYFGSSVGKAKGNGKSPRRVVLRAPDSVTAGSDILCSSVLLTYREGLFYSNKQTHQDNNCTDV